MSINFASPLLWLTVSDTLNETLPVLFVFLIIKSTSFIPYDYRTYIFTKDFYELIYGISVNKIFYRTSTYITIISNNENISGRRINHKYIDQRDCK